MSTWQPNSWEDKLEDLQEGVPFIYGPLPRILHHQLGVQGPLNQSTQGHPSKSSRTAVNSKFWAAESLNFRRTVGSSNCINKKGWGLILVSQCSQWMLASQPVDSSQQLVISQPCCSHFIIQFVCNRLALLSAHSQALLVDSFDVTLHFLINKDESSFSPALNLSLEAVALGVGPISSAQYLPCLSLCVFAAFLK